jgi:hypothetical protein
MAGPQLKTSVEKLHSTDVVVKEQGRLQLVASQDARIAKKPFAIIGRAYE